MPRPECPRCGSALVVAAAATTPSESVLELRSGIARDAAGSDHRLCRACGHQWDAATEPDGSDPEPVEAAPVETRSSAANPAAELRGAREQRGRTLQDASVGTGIQVRHLRALERDAPLEAFPAPTYARFFLREYAEFLDLDPAPLLEGFEARHAPVEEPAPPPAPVTRERPRRGWGVLVVLSVVAIALIAVLPSAFRPDEDETVLPPPVAASPAHDSGHEVVPTPVREPNGVRAVLRLSQPSWVQAVADGEVVEAATLEPGTAVVYRARELLELTLGNAGGVDLRVNGDPVATGGPGDVVTLDFRWRDGEVLAGPE